MLVFMYKGHLVINHMMEPTISLSGNCLDIEDMVRTIAGDKVLIVPLETRTVDTVKFAIKHGSLPIEQDSRFCSALIFSKEHLCDPMTFILDPDATVKSTGEILDWNPKHIWTPMLTYRLQQYIQGCAFLDVPLKTVINRLSKRFVFDPKHVKVYTKADIIRLLI